MASLDPEIVALGKDPVSASAPAGESLREDPEFESLQAEIAKTESLTGAVVDWDLIVRLSTSILKAKSKDYRVASYLAYGLFQTKGYVGLLGGLRMYEGLLKNFWENGFPEKTRMRGRLGAIEWLQDRIAAALARKERKPAPDEVLLDFESAAQDFVSAVSFLCGEGAPQFTELVADAQARANDLRARLAAAEKSREEQLQRAEAVARGEVVDAASAEKILNESREALSRVAEFYFAADATDPISYGLRRGITWGWLMSLPGHEDHATQIPPVAPDVLQRCEEHWTRSEWLPLVTEVETNFATGVFALKLQRYCVHALHELGDSYQAAREAVLSELARVVRRFPELLDLTFNDRTPFAEPATRSWIESEVLAAAPGGRAGAGRGATNGQQDLESATQEARKLLGDGKLQQAVDLFQGGIGKVSEGRLRFLWRLELAKLCLESGKPQLALPQLMILDEDVSRFGLESWEPQLSLAVVQQLFLCRQKLAAGTTEMRPEVERELHELYKRLWRLDASTALTVQP